MSKGKFPISVLISATDRITAPLKKINKQIENTFPVKKISRSLGQISQAMGFPKVASSLGRVRDATGRVGREFQALGMKVGLFVGAAAAGIIGLAISTSNYGDRIAKVAKTIGISSEALQEYRFAAERSGISSDVLDKSFQKFSKTVGEAKAGTGALFTLLNKVSPSLLKQLKTANGTEEAFSIMTKAMSKLEDPTKKAALASAAFGRAGIDMINLLDEGPEGIEKLRQKARELGIMTNENAAEAEIFNDALFDMKFALLNVKNMLGSGLMPVLKEYVDNITKWASENKAQILVFAKNFAQTVRVLIPQLIELTRQVAAFFGTFNSATGEFTVNMTRVKMVIFAVAAVVLGPLLSALASLSLAFISLTTSVLPVFFKMGLLLVPLFKMIGAAILATPIGWLIAGVAAVAGAAFLIYKYWEPIKTFFFGLFDSITSKFEGFLDFFASGIKSVGGLIPGVKFDEPSLGAPQNTSRSAAREIVTQTTNRSEASVNVKFDNLPRGAQVASQSSGILDFGLDIERGPMTAIN